MSYEQHPSCLQPEHEQVPVWRFLNLTKYLDMLHTSELHFARLDQFEDPYEGGVFGVHRHMVTLASDAVQQRYSAVRAENRARMFVNAWHLAEHEPAGMWKQYAMTEPTIAICSTYGRLKRVLDRAQERIFFGLVQYKEPNLFGPLRAFDFVMAKRPSFEHEKEVRAVIWRDSHDGTKSAEEELRTGVSRIRLPVDPAELVFEVRLSPAAPEILAGVLLATNERFGFGSIRVSRSDLYVDPSAAQGGSF